MRLSLPHTRLAWWQPPQHFVVVVTGPRGQGKSTLLKLYLRNVPRCPTWDPKGEYVEILGGPRLTAAEFFERSASMKEGVLRCSVGDPLSDELPDPEKMEADFSLYMRGVWKAGNCCAVVSEVTTTGAQAGYCPPGLAVAVNIGRDTRGLSLLLDAQRAEMVPTLIRSQACEWFAFRPTRVQDTKALQETFRGGDPGALRDHWFLHWTPATGPVPKVLDLATA